MPAPAAPQVVPPGPPRLRLEDKVLSLEFLLLDAQFNEPGKYKLVLRVENPLLDDSVEGITVMVNNGDMIPSCEAETNTAEQEDLTDTLTFDKNNFLFILPKGLCKNDKHHDVRLCIDVLKFGSGSPKGGKKVGQALFAIYPRPNQPRINLRAAPFEPLYKYQGVLALLRVAGDHMAMHCGRLAYNVCFREYKPPKIKDISKPTSPLPISLKVSDSQPSTARHDTDKQSTPTAPTSYISHSEAIRSDPQNFRTATPRIHNDSEDQDLLNQQSSDDEDDNEDEEEVHEVDRLSSPGLNSMQDQDDLEYEVGKTSPRLILPLISQSLPHDAPLRLPSPPKTPATMRKTHVTEKAPAQSDSVQRESKLLPFPGTETIVVTLHSATHIPLTTAGSLPTPFICLMSSIDEKKGRQAQSISHAAPAPTTSPVWGETLTMAVNEEEAEEEELILTVADNPSQDFLLEYRLPIQVLQPFHPYHLCMVKPHDQAPDGCHLYVTIERRTSSFAQQNGFTYSALQVLLVGVETSLQEPSNPLLALARIVPNYKDYRQTSKPPGMPGVSHVKVTFPEPSPSCFQIPKRATQGHAQISIPGLPPSQPIWNSTFLFQGRDGVTLFSEGAALVLEYYPVTADSWRVPWYLSNHCGFSVVPLDMEVYHQLMQSSSNKALTLTGVPIQATELKTISGEAPCVSLQLLLLKTERPEFFLSPSEVQASTNWQTQSNNSLSLTRKEAGSPNKEKLQKDPPFPSYNALADILPDPWVQQTAREQKPPSPAEPRKQPTTNLSPQYLSGNMEGPEDPVMEHQEQELANYRLAMQRMADDIIALNRQMSGLEAENSALRSERSLNQDAGRSLLSDTDIDVMTKAELADRLVTLKQKLASETSELRSMRDRIQQLQNDLVRRNDREKELLLLQRAHQQQQAVLSQYHQRLSRAKALQDTVRKQEKVIEKMEKLLDSKLKDEKRSRMDKGDRGPRSDTIQGEVYATLLAENSRLREELEKARLTTTVIPQHVPIHETFTDSEKLSLLSKLEKSQARVQSLERELEEAARRWGREKQQLLTQLSEEQMGFSRTHTTVHHHFPTKEPELPTRRPTKLDPLM
ncbi:coiled-coil domain-containing protein 33 [Bufo gargarizans]|uniref:coiled-coil domain-containing protein 33 n=1 Tax=Bufo gargarizans TaxID=30331 RepID=UPI001CF33089|nr:coiled-coil domain-containing protein 33 [Bufo gargarizans]